MARSAWRRAKAPDLVNTDLANTGVPAFDPAGGADFDPLAHGWALHDDPGFTTHAGPMYLRGAGTGRQFGMKLLAHHINKNGVAHGGAVCSLMDESLGHYCMGVTGHDLMVSVQMNLNWVSAGWEHEFLVTTMEISRVTRSIIFVRGVMRAGERIVATAEGVYKQVRLRPGDQAPGGSP